MQNAKNKDLTPIFRKRNVCKAILFGSAARGSDTRRSDLDLLIVQETTKRFFARFDEFDEIHEVMKGRAVDLLIYTPEELLSISCRPFIKRILAEGKTIYER
jgi:predicted nucleotidyltransferase